MIERVTCHLCNQSWPANKPDVTPELGELDHPLFYWGWQALADHLYWRHDWREANGQTRYMTCRPEMSRIFPKCVGCNKVFDNQYELGMHLEACNGYKGCVTLVLLEQVNG